MSEFDPKLEHLLNNWFHAKDGNHEIRLMFKKNDLYQFKDFVGYNKQLLLGMRRQKHNVSTPFNGQMIKMINNKLLYHCFMRRNNDKVTAENPNQWVMAALTN